MKLITHLVAAITISHALNINPWATIIGALLPDTDFLIGLKHRGLTHSLWMLLTLLTPIGLGVISHITLDLLTPSGCRLTYPSRTRYRLGVINDIIIITLSGVVLIA